MDRVPLTAAAVIADAAALADEAGFAAVTLSAIARRLGVQTPSLYSHVRDRDALLDGVTALAMTELAGRISAGVAGHGGRPALEGYATAYRQYAHEHPGRWQSMQRRAGDIVVGSAAARDVVSLTGAVLRGYAIPPDEHVHAVRLLGSTINGFLAIERVGGFDHSAPAPEVSWLKIIDLLDALLRAWPAGPPDDRTAPRK
jgi:AcrR family transcriptional regulator